MPDQGKKPLVLSVFRTIPDLASWSVPNLVIAVKRRHGIDVSQNYTDKLRKDYLAGVRKTASAPAPVAATPPPHADPRGAAGRVPDRRGRAGAGGAGGWLEPTGPAGDGAGRRGRRLTCPMHP